MPLKVLMFGWEFPPFNSGGLGIACRGLTQALSRQNIDITFVLPQKADVKADFMRMVFADIGDFDWPVLNPYASLVDFSPGLPPQVVQDLFQAVSRYAYQAARIAGRYPHHSIHCHDGLCSPAGISANHTSGKPLITHVHATEFDRGGGNGTNPVVYAVEKMGLDKSTAVITVSQFTKNILQRFYHIHSDKVNVVYNGVDTQEWTAIDEDNPLNSLKQAGFKVVLFLGRLTLQKGPDYFLTAARRALDFAPLTVFLLVGSGDMEQQLIHQSVEQGISDHVLFAGFLRGEELHQAFTCADLFVMPSVSEPFGITALESVAAGTPAIISKQSGVSEALGHVLKVDFWDVEEMANQIISVLNYPSLRTALKANGQDEVKKVSWQAAAAKTIEVYKKVLNQN